MGGERYISPPPRQSGPSYAGSAGSIGTGGPDTNTNSLRNRIPSLSPPPPLAPLQHHPVTTPPSPPVGSTSNTSLGLLGGERERERERGPNDDLDTIQPPPVKRARDES